MQHCADTPREGQDGTWISNDMLEAYCKLHELGFAHSFESYLDGHLVGGLYGVAIGKAFFGESMFHTVSDASKVAFYQTPHLKSLGAHPIPRHDFLEELEQLVVEPSLMESWR